MNLVVSAYYPHEQYNTLFKSSLTAAFWALHAATFILFVCAVASNGGYDVLFLTQTRDCAA